MDLVFQSNPHRREPVFRQLADHIAGLARSGRLAAGSRLPATRELASVLGLGRNTVTRAYETLVGEGVCTARLGQGTFLSLPGPAPRPPSAGSPPAAEGGRESPAAAAQGGRPFSWNALLSRRSALDQLPAALARVPHRPRIDFRGGLVDAASLPARELSWAFTRALSGARRIEALAHHRDPFGWHPLREQIVRHLVSRGLEVDVKEVAVVNGAQQAIHLAARTLVDPGDTVAVEDPGYFGAVLALRSCEAHVVGVPVDGEGLRTDHLARLCESRRPKLIYVTPATQCPTGARLSEQRREELLHIIDRYQVPLFEDDYDAELRYADPVVPALKTHDRMGQIIYAGTFSKILFPSLRLGYVVAPRPLLERMVLARWRTDFASGAVEQAAVASLLAGGALPRHLKRVREIYACRLAAMLDALAASMPPGVAWSRPLGGQGVWLTLPRGVDPLRFRSDAADRGIALDGEGLFTLAAREGRSFMLAFTALDEATIAESVRELADLVKAQLSGGDAHGDR